MIKQIINTDCSEKHLGYLLSNFETECEVEASVLRVEFRVLERIREEVVDESTEGHAVVPTTREVCDVHVLATTQQDVRQLSPFHLSLFVHALKCESDSHVLIQMHAQLCKTHIMRLAK